MRPPQFLLWITLACSALFAHGALADTAEPLSIVLSHSTAAADAGKSSVTVTITNNSDTPIKLSDRFLPFDRVDQLPANMFKVTDLNGNEQFYQGRFDHYLGNSASQFVTVAPHQSLSGKVELRLSYRFDTQFQNQFRVSFSMPVGIMPDGEEKDVNSPTYPTDPNRARTITSNEITIAIDPFAPFDPPAVKEEVKAGSLFDPVIHTQAVATSAARVRFINDIQETCSEDQEKQIIDAYQVMKVIAGTSAGYVRSIFDPNNPRGPQAKKDWIDYFGSPFDVDVAPGTGANPNYYGVVGQSVARMEAMAQLATPSRSYGYSTPISCWCPPVTKRTEGRVGFNEQGVVHLCPLYFTLPLQGGLESQAMSLYHEHTHKYVIATLSGLEVRLPPTGDFGYGANWDRREVLVNRAHGLLNADTYERFGALAMKAYSVPGW